PEGSQDGSPAHHVRQAGMGKCPDHRWRCRRPELCSVRAQHPAYRRAAGAGDQRCVDPQARQARPDQGSAGSAGSEVRMNRLSAYDIIRNPVVTEKSTMASEINQVVFDVAIDANKADIKTAVEQLFSVKVKAV